MAQLSIAVNGRSYLVGCEDGQEDRLRDLAAQVDGHVRGLVQRAGQAGEARLLLMAALTLADDLRSAREEIATLQSALKQAEAEAENRQSQAGATESDLAALAARLEDVAARLDNA